MKGWGGRMSRSVLLVFVLALFPGMLPANAGTGRQICRLPLDVETPANFLVLGAHKGSFYVLAQYGSMTLMDETATVMSVHMSNGSIQYSRILRNGQGPGEFKNITSGKVDTTNGDVILYDSALKRVTILDATLSKLKKVGTVTEGGRYVVGTDQRYIICLGRYYRKGKRFVLQFYDRHSLDAAGPPVVEVPMHIPAYIPMQNSTVTMGPDGCYRFVFPLIPKMFRIDPKTFRTWVIPLNNGIRTRYEELPREGGTIDVGLVSDWYSRVGTTFETALCFESVFVVLNRGPRYHYAIDIFDDRGALLKRMALPRSTRMIFKAGSRLFFRMDRYEKEGDPRNGIYVNSISLELESE